MSICFPSILAPEPNLVKKIFLVQYNAAIESMFVLIKVQLLDLTNFISPTGNKQFNMISYYNYLHSIYSECETKNA